MSSTAVTSFSNLSILLVEDEPFSRRLAVSVLRQLGVNEIIATANGEEAMRALSRTDVKFDLIISDWNMPEMTGIDLLRRVRESWPDMPFIMLTGNTVGKSVLAAKEHGVNGYIVKPFALGQVAAKIASVLKIKLP